MANVGFYARLMRYFRGDSDIKPSLKQGNIIPDAMGGDRWEDMQRYLQLETRRKELYNVYDEMDQTNLAASVLDLFADDAMAQDPYNGQTVWVESQNPVIEKELNRFLRQIRFSDSIEEVSLARDIAKYGDEFERIVYRSGDGILATHPVLPRVMTRKESKERKLLGFVQDGVTNFRRDGKSNISYPWDYMHFRLRGRDRWGIYGTGLLYNGIRPWRQMIMTEDQDLLTDISKAPDRNLYKIDIGTADETEGARMVQSFKKAVRYSEYNNPRAKGLEYDHRFKAHSPLEDVFMGIRKDNATSVEKINGSPQPPENKRLHYYRDMFLASCRAPKKAFGFEEMGEPYNSKMKTANQDIKYARGVRRLQSAVLYGLRRLCCIHLKLKAKTISGTQESAQWDWTIPGNQFQVKGARVSWLEELEMLEFTTIRMQVTQQLTAAGTDDLFNRPEWMRYVYSYYMQLPDSVLDIVMKSPDEFYAEQEALANADANIVQGGNPNMVKAISRAQSEGHTVRYTGGQASINDDDVMSMFSEVEQRHLMEVAKKDPQRANMLLRCKVIGRLVENTHEKKCPEEMAYEEATNRALSEDMDNIRKSGGDFNDTMSDRDLETLNEDRPIMRRKRKDRDNEEILRVAGVLDNND